MECFDRVCHFCLAGDASGLIALNDQELNAKIMHVFCFEITLPSGSCGLICGSCKILIEEFYWYAEQVARNQEQLREKLRARETPDEAEKSVAPCDEPQDETEKVPTKIEEADRNWMLDDDSASIRLESEPEHTPELIESFALTDIVPETSKVDTAQHSILPEDKAEDFGHGKSSDGTKLTSDQLVLQHYELSCDLCSVPLVDFGDLRKHYKLAHNVPGYLRCCNKVIHKKCWMIEHLQLHLNPDTFRCDQCSKSYSSSKVLKEHVKEIHASEAERSFRCNNCAKSFVSKAHLNAHIMVAHGSVPCPQCAKVLASQGSLRKHLLAVHGEGEKHVCEVCARVFRSKQCFETHRKEHEGRRLEGKVQCGQCGVWLMDKYCLTKHMRRMHTLPDGGLLSCGTCGKTARNQDALKCHIRRAHRESRFECERCHKRFKRPHHRREHIAIYHTGEDLYGCQYCPERFNTKNKLYFHRKTTHPQEYEQELRKRALKE